MAYATIQTRIYGETDILDLSMRATWLYVYLLTCDRCHRLTGIFTLAPAEAMLHTKIRPRRCFDRALAELDEAGKVRLFDGGWLWIVRKAFYEITSLNHLAGAEGYLARANVPQEIQSLFWQRYGYLRRDITR